MSKNIFFVSTKTKDIFNKKRSSIFFEDRYYNLSEFTSDANEASMRLFRAVP